MTAEGDDEDKEEEEEVQEERKIGIYPWVVLAITVLVRVMV